VKRLSSKPAADERLGRALLLLALTAGTALRVRLAWRDDGIFWPDEIFQTLEPAHRAAFGYGLLPQEFIHGARNWALPGLLALFLKACALAGGDSPRIYGAAAKLLFCAVGVATAAACRRLARNHGAGPLSAACGAAFFALSGPAIYFAPRAMSETAAALPILLAFVLASEPRLGRAKAPLAGALAALACMFRLQSAVFLPGLLAALHARGKRPLRAAAIALGAGAFLFGLIDRLTWGGWFSSVAVYLRANVLEGLASAQGTAPLSYYPRVSWTSMGVPLILLAPLSLAAARRAPALFWSAAAFVLLHAAIPHKEIRFLMPALPLFCALAGIGLEAVGARFGARAAAAACLAACALGLIRYPRLTLADLGQDAAPGAGAFDEPGDLNRLLLDAHDQNDVCGLRVETAELQWTGAYTYFHRPAPLYGRSAPEADSRFYNYAISAAPKGEIVSRRGGLALTRLFPGSCRRDPSP